MTQLLPPILSLYTDIWTQVTPHLDLGSLRNLILCSDARLSRAVGHAVRFARFDSSNSECSILSMERILSFCKTLPSIEELVVHADYYQRVLRTPFTASNLPSTLASLELSFYGVFSLIQPIQLSNVVPLLTKLSLDNKDGSECHCLADFDLPPLVTDLSLISADRMAVSAQGIAQLPRNLTSLALSWYTDMEKLGGLEFGADLKSYEWPLTVTSCTLSSSKGPLRIEHLPRTLEYLDVIGQMVFSTSFEGRVLFPWRVFFPRLHTIKFWHYLSSQNHPQLLDTLVRPDALDSSHFISSGFWNLPASVLEVPTTYPNYRCLELPDEFWESFTYDDGEEMMKTLAPFLQSTSLPRMPLSAPYSGLIPPQSQVTLSSPEVYKYSSNLEVLDAQYSPVMLPSLPPSLTELNCQQLVVPGSDLPVTDGFPPKLRKLTIQRRSALDAVTHLPSTLTYVDCIIASPQIWNLMATELSSLRKLNACLTRPWDPSAHLSPFQSQCFEDVYLRLFYPADEDEEINFEQFFGANAVWPPTMRILRLGVRKRFEAQYLAIMPRQLKELYLNHFYWTTISSYPNNPAPEIDGPALLRSLPPKLRKLSLESENQYIGGPKVGWQALEHLPRTLVSFMEDGLFDYPKDENGLHADVAAVLPPQIQRFTRSTRRTDMAQSFLFN